MTAPWFTVSYSPPAANEEWEIYLVNEVRDWIDSLAPATHARVVHAIDLLVAGDKAGRWNEWYAEAIPLAE